MEIAIASGKGGTGKTFISSNLIYYVGSILNENVVGVDADVEAPDLVLALGCHECKVKEIEFRESRKAKIIHEKCINCEECLRHCKFNAIVKIDNKLQVVKEFCEGCGVCLTICPVKAIELSIAKTGVIEIYECSDKIRIISGDLDVGEKTSGHLVYEMRNLAKELAGKYGAKNIVIDVAAGIGCQVISSIVGDGENYFDIISEGESVVGRETVNVVPWPGLLVKLR